MSKGRQNRTGPPPAQIEVSTPKGRPMLSWVGKKPLRYIPSLPAQHIESFDPSGDLAKLKPRTQWVDWPSPFPKTGLLFHGDNREVLAHLLANGFRGRVNLIYIDPPFDSGADYVRTVQLRGIKGISTLEGEAYSLGEQIQYTDIWANDNYLQFMFERLLLLKELLADTGSIFLHCDYRKSHHLRCLMDEVFGPSNYRNEISWKRTTARSGTSTYNHIHDTILFYTKSNEFTWNQQYLPYSEAYLDGNFKPDADGRLYRETPITAPGTRTGSSGAPWKGLNPSLIGRGRHWAIPSFLNHLLSDDAKKDTLRALDELEALGRIRWARDGEGRPNAIQFSNDLEGVEVQSIWLDFGALSGNAEETTDYPTQKPEALLNRIISGSSNPGDIVLDCFVGSGTTCAVAQRMGRRWIGADINKGAIETTSKRLQKIITEGVSATKTPQQPLPGIASAVQPPQLSLCVFRVNDYDLQVQHNEAVKLACEYIGVETMRSDSYFDGTLGKSLAKVIPFNHPLSPVDLEDLKRELEARKNEDRDITLVCLGMEIAAQAWVEEWNRLRKKSGNVPNRLRVIELRTDPSYSGFLKHDPASAKITITRDRKKGLIVVAIVDFISPTIVKRLNIERDLFQKKIKDWRSMVDCVMIDPAYDGHVLNIAVADVPETKDRLVSGNYEVPVGDLKSPTTVAVKIIDMLGEEVITTSEV